MHHRHTEKHRHEGKPRKTRNYQRLCSVRPALCATVCSEKRSQVGQAVHPKCRVRRCKCYCMLGVQLCSLHTGHSTADSSCCCCRVHLRASSSAIPQQLVSQLEFNVPFQHKYSYIRDERSVMESYPYPVKEGQRYIKLNPGRLFVQQPPKKGKGIERLI